MVSRADRLPFRRFYREVFLAEHRHPINIALHAGATLASAAYVVAVLAYSASAWWLLLYPAVHAVPGLVGHRLFERNANVGDVRVLRRDYPAIWFIAGNHLMTLMLLSGRLASARADAG
jgi:hypothetical protein